MVAFVSNFSLNNSGAKIVLTTLSFFFSSVDLEARSHTFIPNLVGLAARKVSFKCNHPFINCLFLWGLKIIMFLLSSATKGT